MFTTALPPCGPASAGRDDIPLTMESAREYLEGNALTDGHIGRVGLELESHLVDLAQPACRVSYERTVAAIGALPALPGGSLVTLEPGGQLELSTPPGADVSAVIELLQRDCWVVSTAFAAHRWGLASLGADPARPPERVNPAQRYTAMEAHFSATGRGVPGQKMMFSTASLQLNLDAGPAAGWTDRIRLAYRLGPVLVAISARSPLLAGRSTGWRSTRQQVWGELDERRCGPLPGVGGPASEWADFALQAPVMLVRAGDPSRMSPVRETIPFAAWVDGRAELGGRRPTLADLRYHLTTLFPPVRLRGFLELRYLDAAPARWWPALAVVVATLMDDPRAADLAAEAIEPVAKAWAQAAHVGLADPALATAARRCLDAVAAAPSGSHPQVQELAELVAGGRCPGDAVAERARDVGPLRVLQEFADD